MKKILSLALIAAVSSALAVESSNTFGILRVDSTSAQTIVSVPWEGAGATGDDAGKIMVKDIVKTANLTKSSAQDATDGDKLYLYTGGQYYAWYLNYNGAWTGIQIAAADGLPAAGNDDTKKISRGDAIILVRQNPTITEGDVTKANPFYLYGQYTSSSATVACVAGGHTLIAPPTTTDTFNLNGTDVMTGTPAAGDYIIVGPGKILTYKAGTGWAIKKTTVTNGVPSTTYDTESAKIPAGIGVWYVSTGTSAPTFNF